MKLQESGQMYLETILVLSHKIGDVRAIDVAHELNFSKPSVSRAMGLLSCDGYIDIKDNLITLTVKGREIAEDIYEKHKVLSKFLMQIGVDEKIAIEDACKIEHDISKESFEAIKKQLKD